jgi:hypothetical protein
MKLEQFIWTKAEIKQFLANKKGFAYSSIVLWVATAAACFLLTHDTHPKLSALDKIIGTWMDESFVGPAVNALINYAIDSPGSKDTYSVMPGIGSGMLVLTLLAATIITLSIWYCLLIADSISTGRANRKARQAATAIPQL